MLFYSAVQALFRFHDSVSCEPLLPGMEVRGGLGDDVESGQPVELFDEFEVEGR